MRKLVLLDTGPLVAYLDRSEQFHAWAVERFRQCTSPLLVCEAVLTEACFLLAGFLSAREAIRKLLQRGVLVLAPTGHEAQQEIFLLMTKYAKVPMSYTDACLVWLAQRHAGSKVFTLDSDFHIYRLGRAKPIPLIAPT